MTFHQKILLQDEHAPLVIMDTMNGFFRWYHSSLSRVNRAMGLPRNTRMKYDDRMGISALLAAFETTFREYFINVLHHTRGKKCNVIMAFDCKRGRIWRNRHTKDAVTNLSTYKATRKTRKDAGIYAAIRFMFDDMLPRLLPGQCIGVPESEADDIVAVITRLVNARCPNRWVYIVSDDSDFIQLLDHPTNEICTQRYERITKCRVSARKHLLKKIIGGDRLDNIPPAFPECDKHVAEELTNDPGKLRDMITTHGEMGIRRNRLLIDFDEIPINIKSRIIEKALLIRSRRT